MRRQTWVVSFLFSSCQRSWSPPQSSKAFSQNSFALNCSSGPCAWELHTLSVHLSVQLPSALGLSLQSFWPEGIRQKWRSGKEQWLRGYHSYGLSLFWWCQRMHMRSAAAGLQVGDWVPHKSAIEFQAERPSSRNISHPNRSFKRQPHLACQTNNLHHCGRACTFPHSRSFFSIAVPTHLAPRHLATLW